jgi:hypothetical protein
MLISIIGGDERDEFEDMAVTLLKSVKILCVLISQEHMNVTIQSLFLLIYF